MSWKTIAWPDTGSDRDPEAGRRSFFHPEHHIRPYSLEFANVPQLLDGVVKVRVDLRERLQEQTSWTLDPLRGWDEDLVDHLLSNVVAQFDDAETVREELLYSYHVESLYRAGGEPLVDAVIGILRDDTVDTRNPKEFLRICTYLADSIANRLHINTQAGESGRPSRFEEMVASESISLRAFFEACFDPDLMQFIRNLKNPVGEERGWVPFMEKDGAVAMKMIHTVHYMMSQFPGGKVPGGLQGSPEEVEAFQTKKQATLDALHNLQRELFHYRYLALIQGVFQVARELLRTRKNQAPEGWKASPSDVYTLVSPVGMSGDHAPFVSLVKRAKVLASTAPRTAEALIKSTPLWASLMPEEVFSDSSIPPFIALIDRVMQCAQKDDEKAVDLLGPGSRLSYRTYGLDGVEFF